jgi:hypothetical protein
MHNIRKLGQTPFSVIIGSDWIINAGLVVRRGKVFCCLETQSSIRIPGTIREIGDDVFSFKVLS